ncbi:MAG TPA: hypothetical protein VKE24_02995, partial [Candidatus Acidoferrales bacterium]|nr:hypothetical protein [Candidatus Acidoferrales bacterium]
MAHDAAEVDLTSDRFPETKVDNSQVEIRQGLLASEQESDSSPGKHAEQVRRFWPDILLVVILAALAGLASYQGQRLVGSFIVRDLRGNNIWFEGDCPYVFTHMVDRTSNQRRTAVHPLFPLAAYPPVYALRKMAKMEGVQAVRFVIAVLAGSWLGVLFVLLRLIGCPTFDAMCFSLLAATSAMAVFWLTVPETFAFGSLTILLGLSLIRVAEDRNLSFWWFLGGSALTLSMTKTNWMLGLFGTIAHYPWKRAIQISVNAFCLVVGLWSLEKLIFPSAEFFIGSEANEKGYLLLPRSGGPLRVFLSFMFHSMIMPAIRVIVKPEKQPWQTMSTQMSWPGSGSLWGAVGVGVWAIMLGLGLWALFGRKPLSRFSNVLALTLLGQLALHILYGDETFLYALHFGPLLIVLAALSTLTRARLLALILAGALTLLAGVNNV